MSHVSRVTGGRAFVGPRVASARPAGSLMRTVFAKERVKPPSDDPPFRLAPEVEVMPQRARIRCPHCQWQPKRTSTWMCLSCGHPEYFDHGCGHSWNTFDTRGRCPGCSYQWLHTTCLACERWSLHQDWYEKAGGTNIA